jgi:hypothetical protein
MKYIVSILCLIALLGISRAYAHGGFEEMKPAELEKMQRMLVREGYLDPKDVQYGVYAYESEEAFDRWDTERIKKNMQKQLEEMRAEQAAKEAAAPALPFPPQEPMPWWKRFVVWVKGLF